MTAPTFINPKALRILGAQYSLDECLARGIKPKVIVKQYERPEQTPSGLLIPEPWRLDKSWSLWEVVKSTQAADEALHITLHKGDIIKSKVAVPVDSGFLDEEDSRRLFFLVPDRAMHVIPNTWTEEQ